MYERNARLLNKLDELKNSYNVEYKLSTCLDKDMKRQWKRDSEEIRSQWQYINSVADVQKHVNWFDSTVARYET